MKVFNEDFSAYNTDNDINSHGCVVRMCKWIENRIDEIDVISIVPTEVSRTGAVGGYSIIFTTKNNKRLIR